MISSRLRHAWAGDTWLWLVASWYVLTRVAVLALLAGPVADTQRTVGGLGEATYPQLVTIWDGQWYERIATWGYPLPLPMDAAGQVAQSEWAFYPLFPLLVRLVMALGPPFWLAAHVVTFAAGAVAVLLAYRLMSAEAGRFAVLAGRQGGPQAHDRVVAAHRRTAALAIGLWLLYPATAVLQVAYTEALALALVLAVLWAMHRHRYGLALVLVLVLGFARAIAPPLAFVVFVHLATRWDRERKHQRRVASVDTPSESAGGPRRIEVRWWWISGAAVLAGTVIAGIAWPVLVGWLTGRPEAFFAVQATWGQRPDRGLFVPWWTWLSSQYGVIVAVGWAVALLVLCGSMLTRYAEWLPLELRTWGFAYPLYLFAVTAPSTSMIRFLILDLPIFAVLAAVLVGDPRRGVARRWWPVGALAAVPLLAWGVSWWATVLLVFTPPMDWPP